MLQRSTLYAWYMGWSSLCAAFLSTHCDTVKTCEFLKVSLIWEFKRVVDVFKTASRQPTRISSPQRDEVGSSFRVFAFRFSCACSFNFQKCGLFWALLWHCHCWCSCTLNLAWLAEDVCSINWRDHPQCRSSATPTMWAKIRRVTKDNWLIAFSRIAL